MTFLATSDFAQAVTFIDPHNERNADSTYPIQVPGRVEIDGRQVPGVIGYDIEMERDQPTVVVLDVLAEHVAPPVAYSDDRYATPAIDGHPVLTPAEEIDPDTGMGSGWSLLDGDVPAVRCRFFARSIHFV